MRDDMLHETPVVKEALRRLPQSIVDERNFRIVRAGYLCLRKEVLPKEQWTKLSEVSFDFNNNSTLWHIYLISYILKLIFNYVNIMNVLLEETTIISFNKMVFNQ